MLRWLKTLFTMLACIVSLSFSMPLESGIRHYELPARSVAALDDLARLLRDGETIATTDRVEVRGIAPVGTEWSQGFTRLRASLPGYVTLVTNVFVIDPSVHVTRLCSTMFAAIPKQPVRFHLSGTRMRSSSYAALDRIAEFARDCPDSKIEITGHSDATGWERSNRALSKARAQAVADYLAARGADPERLIVAGVGSSEPIAENSSTIGRERNRRIEFALHAGN
jgi:OOP family OmpA-OmpF porin